MITYLYRCFDREGELLYVGITDDVERRKREHAKDKFWWRDVTRVTKVAFPRRVEALWAEWAVITTCKPAYNRAAVVPDGAPDAPPAPVMKPARPTAPRATRPHAADLRHRIGQYRASYPDASNRAIGRALNCSESTVRNYMRSLRNNAPTE